tara:strand:- start:515 stop:2638 length:2124 start_codon:yes stop_codon:yes gene_type:complete
MKISILLPYKENFVSNHAGAVSLFVNDITERSKFKKTINIFGSTQFKKFLSKNYINLTFDKRLFLSSNNQYVDSFINYKNILSSELIEVHNRPIYIKKIRNKYTNKLFLFFHNDPLEMSGSKTINERLDLLKTVDMIIFNSEWCRDRFFINITNKKIFLEKTSVCYQSSSSVKIDFTKKKKIISFVGKLNRAKGYDLFGNAIIKILDDFPEWSSNVYGDEPREKLIFKHKNLKIQGFKNNNIILNDLKKTSISVICSRWDEPFGRTSLEASSRGSAVIISDKGGLPETATHAIVLKNLSSKNIYEVIKDLINNKKKLLSLQKKNYTHFKFTHSYIAKLIDQFRKQHKSDKTVKLFNIKKNFVLKIMHVTNFNRRFKGRLHYNTGRRLNNGFVRLGHNVLTLSDRDTIHENINFLDLKGKKLIQKNLLENLGNFKADCIVLGHADAVNSETLDIIKNKNKNLRICQWFLDPVSNKGPDFIKNNKRVLNNINYIDATFLTTCPSILKTKIYNSHYMPNPSDKSFETLKNYEHLCDNDVFFAMSHGVHRGDLKKGKIDHREHFINKLKKINKEIKFDIYGMNNIQPIWGDNFIQQISNSSMGLNLSRGKPIKYYSSDRIAQLLGNGLLTFVDRKTGFNDFLSNKEIIFYDDIYDLSYKINKYKKDKKEAVKIAKRGRSTYLNNFNSTIVADFILSKTLGYKSKFKFIWEK